MKTGPDWAVDAEELGGGFEAICSSTIAFMS